MIHDATLLLPHHLYRLFAQDDTLLYVGITADLDRRLGQHKHRSWWSEVARRTAELYRDRESAETAERAAIRDENPQHNISHSNLNQPTYGRGGDTLDLVQADEVAALLGIKPNSVRDTLRRYGITEQRGYPREAVENLKRPGQGHRTDLHGTFNPTDDA